MTDFIIIHGTKGSPDENWFPWLKKSLEDDGHNVIVPTFPTPEDQDVDNWLDIFEDNLTNDPSNTVLIGHSIGATLMLNALFGAESAFKASIFVAPVLDKINNDEYDALNETFTSVEFDWEDIMAHAGKTHIFYGEGDPYVPKEQAVELQRHLETKLTIIPRGGHLNSEAGWTEFPHLLALINEFL